jgi:glycosyl transferase family 25
MLVLEDDLLIDPVFFGAMDRVATEAARYGYLRLYAKVPRVMWREAAFLDRHVARFACETFGTQGYFVTKIVAAQFLRSVCKLVRPIDDEMDRYWAHGVLIRAIFPFPVMEINLGSTIEAARQEWPQLSPSEKRALFWNKNVERIRRNFAMRRPYGLTKARQ